ncbi:hypothetical protein ACFUN8_13750 [Streptomyces sp. NPDC057307]|uniref:hypothetical protein n=1 Tax=Streptomyces sp. NPDC057307 TaxID=3346096 RepID=UPI00363E31EC
MIGLVLRLYPRRYRQESGEEILAVYRQAAAEASRTGRFREGADIAAHAVRMRLGLSSATAAGRLLANAAPFAVGAAAAGCGVFLTRWYAGMVVPPTPVSFFADAWGALALLLAPALVVVGAITALTGRWHAGVTAVAVGLSGLAAAAVVSGPAFGDPVVTPAMALLTALIVLACPPDLRPGPRACATAGAMAAVAWLPLVAVHARVLPFSTDYGLWPLLVLAATGVVLALRSKSPGPGAGPAGTVAMTETMAMTVACPPFLAYAYTGAWGQLLPVLVIGAVVPLAGGLAAYAHALRLRGRRPSR